MRNFTRLFLYNDVMLRLSVILLSSIVCPIMLLAQGVPAAVTPPRIASGMRNVLPATVFPPMPDVLDFAGEKVPLENYDTRESLAKELAVTCYMHSRTLLTLAATTRYLPVIEPILARNGIPSDFKYLCMAESGLNPNVVSAAGAAGLWQLMPSVGKARGMIVTGEIDERYNIEQATQAACDYLREAKAAFGSWTMAAASYNLGLAGLRKRADKQRIGNYYDLFMPEETLRYVFRILAWKLVAEDPAKYGFSIAPDEYQKPLDNYKEVETDEKTIDWSEFAARHGTTYKMLRELNHWIRDYDCRNPSGHSFTVRIPQRKFRE